MEAQSLPFSKYYCVFKIITVFRRKLLISSYRLFWFFSRRLGKKIFLVQDGRLSHSFEEYFVNIIEGFCPRTNELLFLRVRDLSWCQILWYAL